MRIALVCIFVFFFSTIALIAVSRPKPKPQEGQVAFCNNDEKTKPANKCDCERTDNKDCDKPLEGGDNRDKPGARCKTYCKPDNCDCKGMCYMPT